jgi:hypothetical protein
MRTWVRSIAPDKEAQLYNRRILDIFMQSRIYTFSDGVGTFSAFNSRSPEGLERVLDLIEDARMDCLPNQASDKEKGGAGRLGVKVSQSIPT